MLKRLLTFLVATSVLLPINSAYSSEKPSVISFTASKYELDAFDSNLKVSFELIVSHQAGIADANTTLNIGVDGKHSLTTTLLRIDNPGITNQERVVFRGSVEFPRTFPAGVYNFSATGVSSNLYDGRKISTGEISAPKIRELKGATSGIILRSNGFLDLNEDILNGPSYTTTNGEVYENPSKFLAAPVPIFRVGESINLKTYFEVAVDEVTLSATSLTLRTCEVEGNILVFKATGTCTYSVSTSRSKNYVSQTLKDTLNIDSARISQELFIPKIPTQSATNLPITIQLDPVYASGISAVQYVFPETQTSEICDVSGYILRIVSGGICKLTYKSNGNDKFLPSNTYVQEIVIERKVQTIDFTVPDKINLKTKTLSLTAKSSSGAPISFASESPEVCNLIENQVNLKSSGICRIRAAQAGTAQFEPVAETRTISIFADIKKAKCRPKNSKKKRCK